VRILSIQLNNLNSLVGEHRVDLVEGLKNAPIFLVVGPTGAGKSTLMDAVSLALFGRTPRLAVARTDMDPENDARNVMSRGTGEASAQVVFTARDEKGTERKYRATWQCSRARKKPDGALQAPRRTLECEQNGQWISRISSFKAKDYAPEFDKVLQGMSVDDFRRCVLLAQGEFAAFIKADDKDRAAILERLTNTERYQKIGERAARRCREAKAAFDQAEARLQAVQRLSDEQRAALLSDRARLELDLPLKLQQLESVKAARDWLRTAAELQRRCDEAVGLCAEVERLRQTQANNLAALQEHERCAPAWAAWQTWQQRVAGVRAAEEALAQTRQKEHELERQARERRDAEQAAQAELVSAKAELQQRAPEIERARGLRRERQAEARELERVDSKLAEASQRRKEKLQARDTAMARLVAAQDALQAAERVSSDLQPYRPVVESLQALRERASKLKVLTASVAARTKALSELDAELARARDELERARGKVDGLRATAAEAQIALDHAVAELRARTGGAADSGVRRNELHKLLDDAAARRQALEDVVRGLVEIARQRERADRLSGEIVAHNDRLAAALERGRVLFEERRQVQEKRDIAARELEQRRWEHGVAQERARLRPGEPCPLCGSPEHPYVEDGLHRDRDAEIEARCAQLEAEIAGLDASIEALTAQEADAGKAQAAASANVKSLQEQSADTGKALEAAQTAVHARLAGLGMPLDANRREVEEELGACDERRQRIEADLRKLDDADHAVAEATRAATTSNDQLLRAERDAEQARGAVGRLEQLRAARLDEAAREQAEAEQIAHNLASDLGALGIDTGAGLAAALERADRLAADVKRADRTLQEAREKRDQAVVTANAATTAWEAACAAEADLAAEHESRKLRLEQLDRDVAGCLGGEDPEQVQAQIERRIQVASGQADALFQDRTRTEADLAATRVRLEEAAEALSRAREQTANVRSELDRLLSELSIGGDDDLTARVLEPERVAAIVELRRDLSERALKTEALRRDRQRVLEDHLQARPAEASDPARTIDVFEREVAERQGEVDEIRDQIAELRSEIQRDDRQRVEAADASREVDRLRAEWDLWNRLHALIGKNDGQEFRLFAQSLNLADLIRHANVHLARLAPRYELVQALDGKDQPRIAFAVRDAWQAGETRPLTTLSGGETFLVSLSLALALAEYNTAKLPIETLLLDEGFGTLDQETLNVAMHALEALHAQGRQVGIITHVEALRERIGARIVVEKLGNGRSTVRTELGG
jgi:exonuclease SbcC